MTVDELKGLLARLAARPTPAINGRHAYVWHDEACLLRSLAPPGLATDLDLYALTRNLSRFPFDAVEARRVLQNAIAGWLAEHAPVPGKQQVVIVTGNSLVARYRLSLSEFLQAASDFRLFVFVVSPQESDFTPLRPLPRYVKLLPSATFAYLKSNLGERAMIGGSTS
jgi:hypothetical protein